MKKVIFIALTISIVLIIYLLNIDKKVFFVAFGDSLSLGKMDSSITNNNYNLYIKQELIDNNKLENFVNNYSMEGLRINDLINSINTNQVIQNKDKKYTIKNLLIKADMVTISVNHDEVLSKLYGNNIELELYNWVDELSVDYEAMLSLIREYCKEKVFVIGYYYPTTVYNNYRRTDIITYLNNSFKQISLKYDINYIDPSAMLLEGENLVGDYYPSELGYKMIGEQILLKFKN